MTTIKDLMKEIDGFDNDEVWTMKTDILELLNRHKNKILIPMVKHHCTLCNGEVMTISNLYVCSKCGSSCPNPKKVKYGL